MSAGYIYILNNAAMPGYLKIGRSTRKPEDRAREISQGTGVPTPYEVAFDEEVFDCEAAEREIHIRLAKYRFNQDREFFRLPLKQAISEASQLAKEFRERKRLLDEMDQAEVERRMKLASSKMPPPQSPQPQSSVDDVLCEYCHTPIPSHVRGLYYSRCPKCAKTTYRCWPI